MSYLFLRFPGFKRKAVSLSYDDCVEADRKMIEVMTKNGLKGTFNVNSGLFGSEGKHLTAQEVAELYFPSGNEINVHGLKHCTLSELETPLIVNEIFTDRKNLEQLTGQVIKGMAYANRSYESEKIAPILKNCGISYARISGTTAKFDLPEDWLQMQPTCSDFAPNLMDLAKKFVETEEPSYYWSKSPQWFFMYGHARFTYEHKNVEKFTQLCEYIGNRDDIWYATVGEMYRYAQAYKRLEFSADGTLVYNPSAIDVYLDYYEKKYIVRAGETIRLEIKDFP